MFFTRKPSYCDITDHMNAQKGFAFMSTVEMYCLNLELPD